MQKKSFWEQYKMPILLLGGIAIGALIGIISPDFGTKLKPLGDIFLNLMFTIVVPLVFASIASAVGAMANMKRLGKILGSTVLTFLVTGAFAAVCVLIWVNLFNPAAGASIQMGEAEMGQMQSAGDMVVGALTVSDFSELLSKSHMLPLIIFSMIFGFCVSSLSRDGEENVMSKWLASLNDVIMKFVGVIMKVAPIGLGAYFANLIAVYGPELIGDYGRSMVVYYPLCLLYVVIFFPLYALFAAGRVGLKRMLKYILAPAVTAFATQSSAATLPVSKEACQNIGVPEDVSDLVLPMGCTMHMDGSVLSSIVKIAFLFSVFGMDFKGLDIYAMAIAVSILSAFVLSGAPGGGLVGEMLIVSLFGFPAEAFPLIATIGFLVDPAATCLNASGDTIASMIIARLVEGKDWLEKRIASGQVDA